MAIGSSMMPSGDQIEPTICSTKIESISPHAHIDLRGIQRAFRLLETFPPCVLRVPASLKGGWDFSRIRILWVLKAFVSDRRINQT